MNMKTRVEQLERQAAPQMVYRSECWCEQPDGTFRNRDDGRTVTAREFETMERKAGKNEQLIFLTIRRIRVEDQQRQRAGE